MDEQIQENVLTSVAKPKKRAAVAVIGMAVLFLLIICWICFYPDVAKIISAGVSVENIPLQFLSREDAVEKLKTSFKIPKDLKMRAGSESFVVSLKEFDYNIDFRDAAGNAWAIGREGGLPGKISQRLSSALFRHDVRLTSEYDSAKIRKLIEVIDNKYTRKPSNAYIDFEKQKIVPHIDGRRIDQRKSFDIVRESMALYDGREIQLATITVSPKVLTKDYVGVDLKHPLSSFSTKFNEGQRLRSKNLRRIADLLTGVEIKPGKVFSYNESVGERTKEHGFFPAPEIVEGRLVAGYGGGACQGSTTLFNTALFADMSDFEWSPHSQQSHYADPGRDAAVYYGLLDLKFKNPHPNSIFIYATATRGVMTVSMYSRQKLDYKIELRSDWWGREWPGEKEELNPDLAPGEKKIVSKGASSLNASLFRKHIYKNGKIVETQMLRHGRKTLRYPGAKRIIEVGPEPAKEDNSDD